MDPVSAIGVASSALAFAEFSYKFACALYGALKETNSSETETIQTTCEQMRTLAHQIMYTDNNSAVRTLAGQCYKLSDAILKKVEKMQPTKGNIVSIFKTALRSVCSKEEMAELTLDLDRCRSQLHMTLTQKQNEKTAATLKKLDEASDTFQNQLEEYREKTNLQAILNALSFEGMGERYKGIYVADESTFQWVHDKSWSLEWPRKSKPGRDFMEWLESGSGIFHIAGKPGSGKSTLMKYIVHQEKTTSTLLTWADDKKLVQGSYFFWKPGKDLQRNLAGLMRSLLHSILKQCPEISWQLFPDFWNPSDYDPWISPPKLDLEDYLVRESFEKLVGNVDMYADYRYCFFIDGLDEFDDHSQTHSRFVELLKKWANKSQGHLKLCVSSREMPVFLNMLCPQKRIRLQEVTREDIKKVVSSTLEPERSSAGAPFEDELTWKHLQATIINRADGVFLWVTLMLKLVCDALQAKESPTQIQRIIDTTPTELNDLFKHILDQIPEAQRKVCAATFMYALELSFSGGSDGSYNRTTFFMPSSILWYSFLDDYVENPGFLDETAKKGIPCLLSEKDLQDTIVSSRNRISGRCGGLLEVLESDARESGTTLNCPRDLYSLCVKYTHRSLQEFMQKQLPIFWAKHLETFDVHGATLHVIMALISSVPVQKGFSLVNFFETIFSTIQKVRDASIADRSAYYKLFDALDELMIKQKIESWSSRVCAYHMPRDGSHARFANMLELAANEVDIAYLSWRVKHNSQVFCGERGAEVLSIVVQTLMFQDNSEKFLEILRFLFHNGVSPRTLVTLTNRLMVRKFKLSSQKISAWGLLLNHYYYFGRFNKKSFLWVAVEEFLARGAPLPVWTHDDRESVTILAFSDGSGFCTAFEVWKRSLMYMKHEDAYRERARKEKEPQTLANLVSLANPPNAAKLLDLIAQRVKEGGDVNVIRLYKKQGGFFVSIFWFSHSVVFILFLIAPFLFSVFSFYLLP